MKKLLLIICCSLLMTGLSYGAFESQITTLDQEIEDKYTGVINTFLGTYIDKISPLTNTKVVDFQQKRNKVVLFLNENNDKVSDGIFFALEYLVYRIDGIVEDYQELLEQTASEIRVAETQTQQQIPPVEPQETTQTTNIASGSDIEKTTGPDIIVGQYYDSDKILLGGTVTGPVAKFDLTASLEDIDIEDIRLQATGGDFARAIRSVSIYDSEGYVLQTERVSGNFVTFNNINFIVEKGEESIYLSFEVEKIGSTGAPDSTSFTIDIVDIKAKGMISGNDIQINPIGQSNTYTTTPVQINEVRMAREWKNREIDQRLVGSNIEHALGLVVIGTERSLNTIGSSSIVDTAIHTIRVKVYDGTFGENVASTLKISRSDKNTNEISGIHEGNGVVRFSLTNDEDLSVIDTGSTGVFMITGVPTLDQSKENESITIDLISFSEGPIEYSSSEYFDSNNSNIQPTSTLGLRYPDNDGFNIQE